MDIQYTLPLSILGILRNILGSFFLRVYIGITLIRPNHFATDKSIFKDLRDSELQPLVLVCHVLFTDYRCFCDVLRWLLVNVYRSRVPKLNFRYFCTPS